MENIVNEFQQTVAEVITAEKRLMCNSEAETGAHLPLALLSRHRPP